MQAQPVSLSQESGSEVVDAVPEAEADDAHRASLAAGTDEVAAAAADVLTWLAGVEMLIADRQHEYARRMFQLQVEAASGDPDQARLGSARASARSALDEVRELLGVFCQTLSRLPGELTQSTTATSLLSAVPHTGGTSAATAAAAAKAAHAVEKMPALSLGTKVMPWPFVAAALRSTAFIDSACEIGATFRIDAHSAAHRLLARASQRQWILQLISQLMRRSSDEPLMLPPLQ